mgnify:CR=1 FL=1
MEEHNSYRVPAFCPICERVMLGSRSVTTYYDFGCCRDCWVEWVDHREERWTSGWRPTPEQVAAFIKNLG